MTEKVAFEAPDITIDKEFQGILPVLNKKTYAMLEENLLQNGCMHPLILWNNILVDGHNRYEICMKHGIPFATAEKEFASRDDVLIWIVDIQISRRNMSPNQLSYYRGLHYLSDKKIVSNKNGKNQFSEVESQNGTQPKERSTASRLAKQYNVSRNTILRDSQITEAINAIGRMSPEAKRDILSGEVSITKKYLNELLARPEEDVIETATKIKEGTFKNPRYAESGLSDDSTDNSPAELTDAGAFPAIASIIKISEDFTFDLRGFSDDSDKEKVILTLRSHIDDLERLLRQMM